MYTTILVALWLKYNTHISIGTTNEPQKSRKVVDKQCGKESVRGLCVRLNPSNTELNPICHLLALLGTHHIIPVSRIRVKRTDGK